jgi:hypothetical protein
MRSSQPGAYRMGGACVFASVQSEGVACSACSRAWRSGTRLKLGRGSWPTTRTTGSVSTSSRLCSRAQRVGQP